MGELLEYPEGAPFPGVIGRTDEESVPAWPAPRRWPAGAPNVLMVVLDDVGFAQLGCYGSDVETPVIDRLAAGGLRFRRFHTTSMCSPTRACLLTGRNHHTCGMGLIGDLARGFPGYHGRIPRSCGFLPEVLAEQGYATWAIGKWHLAPNDELHMGASKERWPLARGFERFYGFLGAETNQWEPDLCEDNHLIPTPRRDGYHLTEDIVDHAIDWVDDLRNASPEKPFYCWLAFGAGHAPHHVPAEWVERYRGRYDAGWDAWREQVHARQLAEGILAPGTELSPRPEWVPAWDALTEDERRMHARMMEVYAGFLSHTDHHLGRLVDHLERTGDLDDTVIVVVSDNGASAEGGVNGSFNEHLFFNGIPDTVERNLAHLDDLGTPHAYNHYSFGWTMAGNTPFRRWKREVHQGGVADPMIVHWPAGRLDAGGVRHQYTHAVDVVPTLAELLGVELPDVVRGVPQEPVAGRSFAEALRRPDAPEHRRTQYYEQFGCRAIYHDGWKAVAYHPNWVANYAGAELGPISEEEWELYDLTADPVEAHDLAAQHPERLRDLVDLWWAEAGRYQVLPMDPYPTNLRERPTLDAPRDVYVYRPHTSPLPSEVAVNVKMRAHVIVAEVDLPDVAAGEAPAEGVLLCHGGRFGGWSVYVQDGRLHWAHRHVDGELLVVAADEDVPAGPTRLGVEFTPGRGTGGTVRLFHGDRPVGEGEVRKTTPVNYSLTGEGLCCGWDDASPVADYEAPFRFTGTLHRVVVSVRGAPYVDEAGEIARLLAAQ